MSQEIFAAHIEPESPPVVAAPTQDAPSLTYQPALDGLHALAIALVVAFHLNLGHAAIAPGGYIGVDVFFVLSGFLITSLLLSEHSRSGAIRLGRFWSRRVARLAPLLLLLVGFALLVAWRHPRGLDPPSPLGFLAIVGYAGNWVAATGRDSLGSFQYVWSLAVEEQFYLLWPLVIVVLAARWPRRRRERLAPSASTVANRVAVVALAGAVIAMVGRAVWWDSVMRWNAHNGFMLVEVGHHRTRGWNDWFFSTGLRADGLLIGAALAATATRWRPHLTSRRVATTVVVVGLAVTGLIAATASIHDTAEPEWALALLAVSVAAVTAACVSAPTNPATRVLAAKPLVWVGKRSYAIYLLHLPVFLLVAIHLDSLRPGVRALTTVAITLVASDLAHRWVELPAQKRLRHTLRAE